MKKLLFLVAILPLCAMVANANNVIVMDGALGTQVSGIWQYPTITAAVTSANTNNGDTIIIKNASNGLPRAESFTISKALVFVPYYDNAQINNVNSSLDTGGILCSGVWTISGSPGMTVTIIGMNNTDGQITCSASSTPPTAANRCSVRVLGCNIVNTSYTGATIDFNGTTGPSTTGATVAAGNYFDLLVSGSKISTSTAAYGISYQHGAIIGDSIYQASGSYDGILCLTDGAASNDTSFIIGNMIIQNTSVNNNAIIWDNTTTMFDIRNNMIVYYDGTSYSCCSNWGGALFIEVIKVTTNVQKIFNNSIFCNTTSTTSGVIGIELGGNNAGSLNTTDIDIENNLIVTNTKAGGNQIGILFNYNGGYPWTVTAEYNYVDSKFATNRIVGITTGSNNDTVIAIGGTQTSGYPNMPSNFGTGATPTGGTWTFYPISPLAASNSYGPGYSGSSAATTSFGYPIQSMATQLQSKGNPANSFCDLGPYNSSGPQYYPYNTVGCYGGPYNIQQFFAPPAAYINTGTVTSPVLTATTFYGLNVVPGRTFMTPSMFSNVMLQSTTIPTGSFRAAGYDR